jgi:hypothetical protein
LGETAPRPFDPLDYDTIASTVVDALLHQALAPLASLEPFRGAGIYALYYGGGFPPYAPIRLAECEVPIYVGKAVPAGTRKGIDELEPDVDQVLDKRLREHQDSIAAASNLKTEDFQCRFLCVKHLWIPLAEQVLVRRFRPAWNTVLDGFGNHDPGKGRGAMRRPRWDILHPGRTWAARLTCEQTPEEMAKLVQAHLTASAE